MATRDDACRIVVSLPVHLVRDIDLFCAASGLSRSTVLNQAASCYLVLLQKVCFSLQRAYVEGVSHE